MFLREVRIYPHPRLYDGNSILLTKETKKERSQSGNPLQNYGCSLHLVELIPLGPNKNKNRELSGGTPFKITVVIFS